MPSGRASPSPGIAIGNAFVQIKDRRRITYKTALDEAQRVNRERKFYIHASVENRVYSRNPSSASGAIKNVYKIRMTFFPRCKQDESCRRGFSGQARKSDENFAVKSRDRSRQHPYSRRYIWTNGFCENINIKIKIPISCIKFSYKSEKILIFPYFIAENTFVIEKSLCYN